MKRLATPSFLNQLLVSGYQMLVKSDWCSIINTAF